MQLSKHFDKNTVGRDFVVGDLHGNFEYMDKWMQEVDFTIGVDRLFGVGDLIDRGPNSEQALHWYLSIMEESCAGNHERMLIDFHKGEFPTPLVMRNGGTWYVGLKTAERQVYVDAFETMPYAIEVETDHGLIGITHAECMAKTWSEFMENPLKDLESQYRMPSCIWGRDRMRYSDSTLVDGVAMILVGHTVVKSPSRLGNHNYIDTGAQYGFEPTVVQIQG